MVIFPVDDVVPAAEPLPTVPLRELSPDALAIGGDPDLAVLAPNGVHPLLHAVGRAFAEHRPLVLSPDVVWLTVAQGLAQHIRLHAEELRPLLVNHTGRRKLAITLDGPMPRDADSWRHLVAQYAKLLDSEVSDAALFACDFTTSTDVERTAARVVLLDAYSSYFSLWMFIGCGIPSVTLTGTEQDWRTIRARVDELPRFGLGDWHRSLAPIADQFVRAAAGEADTAFWQRIYNPADAYGGSVATGWIARLFPYVNEVGSADQPNPLLELPLDEPRDVTEGGGMSFGLGVRPADVPATLSRVVVNVVDQVEGGLRAVALHGGVVAVAQDPAGALCPVAGWHLAPARADIDDLLDRIEREHATAPPGRPVWYGPAELVAVYQRMSSASLFGGAWQLAPSHHRRQASLDGGFTVTPVFDLPDGRSICWVHRWREEVAHWAVCRVAEVITEVGNRISVRNHEFDDDPAEVWLYGTSLATLLEVALDNGGDIDSLRSGRLADLLGSRPAGEA
ncbi:DUF4419 domain-containing protein [Catellatospora citrea]|uniref:DUF4419 domain-containing protein n=1 Tax=Catellatospora citrea TaxID=53366 RepID=A0A8J3K3C8_9ACTN|nr:DUF4419 domain-containing protein [Catellatospora citrea]RKE12922.1 uncharacterized protein DUF4419 [Catellatospora citrea]GIF95837.1 hypothetical protein Cci01nite_09310 [Catellatospora citrea]